MSEARPLKVLVFPLPTPIGIVKGIGNAFPLRSNFRLLVSRAVALILVLLACIGTIANAVCSCMFPTKHVLQTSS